MVEALSPFIGTIPIASVAFLALVAGTAVLYYALPGPRTRTALLLVVSSLFYM